MAKICFEESTFYTVLIVGAVCIIYTLLSQSIYTGEQRQHHPASHRRSAAQGPVAPYVGPAAPAQAPPAPPVRNTDLSGASKDHNDILQMVNPLVPPLRKGPFSLNRIGVPIGIPSRGEYGKFQSMGYLYNPNNPDQALPLIGRRIHSNQYEYYTVHHNNAQIKIPIKLPNDREIVDGDTMNLSGYGDTMTVKLYELDAPRYIPY